MVKTKSSGEIPQNEPRDKRSKPRWRFWRVDVGLLLIAFVVLAYCVVGRVNAANDQAYAVALSQYEIAAKKLGAACDKIKNSVKESYNLIQKVKTDGLLMPELLDDLSRQSKNARAVDCTTPEEAETAAKIERQTGAINRRIDNFTKQDENLELARRLVMNDAVGKAKIDLENIMDTARKSFNDSDGIADNQLRTALIDLIKNTRENLDQLDTLDAVAEKTKQINDAKQKVEDNKRKVIEERLAAEERRKRAEEARRRAAAAAAAERARAEEWRKVPAGQHIADTARGFLTDKRNAYLYSETWGYSGSPNTAYLQAFRKFESGQPDDCGNFVSTTVLSSGVDPNFTRGWTLKIEQYLSGSSKWSEIPNTGNSADLQAGDVFVVHNNGSGHTFLYIGDGQAAQARLGWTIGYAFDINKQRNEPAGFPRDNISMEEVMDVDGQMKDGIWQGYNKPYRIFRAHY